MERYSIYKKLLKGEQKINKENDGCPWNCLKTKTLFRSS